MLQKIKRVVVICVMLLGLAVNSFAVVPLVIPVVAGMLILATAGGLYYQMKPNTPATFNPSGWFSRPSLLTYALMAGNAAQIMNKDIEAIMSQSKARELANSKNGDGTYKYNGMHQVFNKDDLTEWSDGSLEMLQKVKAGDNAILGSKYGITKVYPPPDTTDHAGCQYTKPQNTYTAGANGTGTITFYFTNGTGYWGNQYCASDMTYIGRIVMDVKQPPFPPNPIPRPNDEAARLADKDHLGDGGEIDPSLQAELDKMYQDPNYVPTFTINGSPLVAPTAADGVMSPADVEKYNAAVAAAAAAAAAAQEAASVARQNADVLAQAATAAQAAAEAAEAAYDAAPTADNARARDAAVAAAAAAQAAATQAATTAAQAEADAAQQEADAAKEEVPLPTPDPQKPRKNFNLDKWKALKNIMNNIGPFAFLGAMGHYFDNLVQNPQAPSFDIPIWGEFKFHIDLSVFDPIAAAFRYVLSAILAVGCTMYIVEFWRGK